jgi:hypothetical protein
MGVGRRLPRGEQGSLPEREEHRTDNGIVLRDDPQDWCFERGAHGLQFIQCDGKGDRSSGWFERGAHGLLCLVAIYSANR